MFCNKNYIWTQGEDLSTVTVSNPSSVVMLPTFQGGGSVLCGFLGFSTGRSMLSRALFLCFSILMSIQITSPGGERTRELDLVSFVSFSWFHILVVVCICGTP